METPAGPVQFGMPPDSIKDTMVRDHGVPCIFVLCKQLFSVERGVAFADIEFPVYYNFFVKNRRALFLGRAGQGDEVLHVLREAMLGPEKLDLREDFPTGEPIPDLRREMDFFRLSPGSSTGRLELDDTAEFRSLPDDAPLDLGHGVALAMGAQGDYELQQHGSLLARVPWDLSLRKQQQEGQAGRRAFRPPPFGVTVLGRGHGFDPREKTTGFILWVGGKGIMVDPPVDSTDWLRARDVSPKLIEGVLLTHTHGDHDAGTLQKLLEEGRMTLFTTPLVYRSFITKYASLIGGSAGRIDQLTDFRPVTIGRPVTILGGEFIFHYTFHTIPALGFEIFYRGRSFCYSGDTLNDPAAIERAHSLGYMDDSRREELLQFPWSHDVIFHECGVPPIHTPLAALSRLPRQVQRRIFLVHTSPSALPPDLGMQVAVTGVERTLRFKLRPTSRERDVQILDILSQVTLFSSFGLAKARDLLAVVSEERFRAGERIITAGEVGDKFYVVASGKVTISHDGEAYQHFGRGDYLGETALILDQPRVADVHAKTDVVVLTIGRDDFMGLIRGTEVVDACGRLARNRQLGIMEVIQGSELLTGLTPTQFTQLESLLHHETVPAGFVLVGDNEVPSAAFLISSGEVECEGERHGRGAVVPGLARVAREERCVGDVRTLGEVTGFSLERDRLCRYLEQNPGLDLRFRGSDG